MLCGVTIADDFVTVPIAPQMSIAWCHRPARSSSVRSAVIPSTGEPSSVACASPANRFAAPGPNVLTHTPGRPLSWPSVSAIYAAAASWCVRTNSIPRVCMASISASTSPPVIP